MSFANTLKELLSEKNISQSHLAAAIGFSQRAVSKWINAQAEPTERAIISCAEFFGITVDEMLGLSENFETPTSSPYIEPQKKEPLPLDEERLLQDYRGLSYIGKARVVAYADLIREQEAEGQASPSGSARRK